MRARDPASRVGHVATAASSAHLRDWGCFVVVFANDREDPQWSLEFATADEHQEPDRELDQETCSVTVKASATVSGECGSGQDPRLVRLRAAAVGAAAGIALGLLSGNPGFGAALAIGVFMGLKGRGARRRPTTTQELVAELEADPEWMATRQREQPKRERKLAEWTAPETPLVSEPRRAGLDVATAWDLVNTADPYPEARPILVRRLELACPDRVREGIERPLAVPAARPHWQTLIRLFEAEPPGTDMKDGLAVALSGS